MGVVKFSYKNCHALVSVSDSPYTVRYDDIEKAVLFIRNGDNTVLANNVPGHEEGMAIIDEFIDLYTAEESKTKVSIDGEMPAKPKKHSNWIVGLICLIAVTAFTTYSYNSNYSQQQSAYSLNSFGSEMAHSNSAIVENEAINEIVVSDKGIQKILDSNITDAEIADIQKGKEMLFAVLNKARSMNEIERKEYLKSPEVQSLINKKWARDFLE